MKKRIKSKSTSNRKLFGLFAFAGVLAFGVYLSIQAESIYADPVQAEVESAAVTVFTSSTSIGSGNTTYDGDDITCDGTSGGVVLTIDGAHTFNSLSIINDCNLVHSSTTTGTVYRLNLTITNAVLIDSSSSINVDGRGFTKGYTYDPGSPDVPTTTGGATSGSAGGSHGGYGGGSTGIGVVYDSIFEPEQPGGGSGLTYDAHGGGAVKISASSLALNGVITADGVTVNTSGAGGAVWLVISGNITGTGSISADGNIAVGNGVHGAGAGGRIAVEYGGTSTINSSNLSARGRHNVDNAASNAGAGTVYIEGPSHIDTQGELYIDNNGIPSPKTTPNSTATTLTVLDVRGGSYLYDTALTSVASLTVDTSAKAELYGAPLAVSGNVLIDNSAELMGRTMNVTGNTTVSNGANFSHPYTTTSDVYRLILSTANLSIDATSTINIDGRGFTQGKTFDSGSPDVPKASTGSSTSGGSHGGYGGASSGVVYDSIFEPSQPGAGAGSLYSGEGGGAVKITADSLILDGVITADGTANFTTGAGGSVWLIIAGNITGSGTISADGNIATGNGVHGAGAGGRIAMEYGGTSSLTSSNLSAAGRHNVDNAASNGGAGTMYIEGPAHTDTQGDLYIDNNGTPTSKTTPTSTAPTLTVLDVRGGAYLYDTAITSTSSITVDTSATAVLYGTPLAVSGNVLVDNSAELMGRTMNVTGNTTVSNGANFSHPYTTTSTVYRLILATANLIIGSGSQINIDGRGFTQGYTYNSGSPDVPTTTGAPASTSGGSHGGYGGATSGVVYDSIFEPSQPGSGAGSLYSGEGGGVVKITASSLTLDGVITADGTTNNTSGAGGAVWLVISGSITGSGTISADGNIATGNGGHGAGAGGRVAVEYGGTSTINSSNLSARGRNNTGVAGTSTVHGAAGTIYIEGGAHADMRGDLFIGNSGVSSTKTTPVSEATTWDNVSILNSAYANFSGSSLVLSGDILVDSNATLLVKNINATGDVTISTSSNITHPYTTTSVVYRLNISSGNLMTIDATSTINLDGRGFTKGYTYNPGSPDVPTTTGGATSGGAGGSHGGFGGGTSGVGVVYDSIFEPEHPGGGSGLTYDAHGGGAVKITASSLVFNGVITADGVTVNTSGAGGAVWLVISGNITGTGSISADGNTSAGHSSHGAGGGGRIAVEFGGTSTINSSNLSARGRNNTGVGGSSDIHGTAGTIYIEGPSHTDTQGDLYVDNTSVASTKNTPLFYTGSPASYTVFDLSVINLGRLSIDQPPCVTGPVLTVLGARDYSGSGLLIDNSGGNCTASYTALNISPTSLGDGVSGVAYSDLALSGGGYAPKSWECLDGLGGSVVTCNNALAGLPNGLTMDAAGVITGTPTTPGVFNFVVKVTDSESPTPATNEGTLQITIGVPPNVPTIVSPSNLATTSDLSPELSANYIDSDAGDVGTTEYRVSSGSSADCLSNINIVASGSSTATSTNNEATTFVVSPDLLDATTYEWCARNNDGVATSAWTTMGAFDTDITYVPGGGFAQQQQQQQEEEQQEEVAAPAAPGFGAVEVLGPNDVRYNWTDLSADEDGFRLLDNAGEIIIDSISAGTTSVTEGNLPHNTQTDIRKVVAFNSAGQSPPSEAYPQAITAMPSVTASVFFMGDTGIRVGIEETLNNLTIGESGVEFELMLFETTLNAAALISSGWIQQEVYVFSDVDPSRGGEVRARARNQVGLITEWSQFSGFEEMIPIEEVVEEVVEEVIEEAEEIEEALPVEEPREEETSVIEELLTELFEEELAEILGEGAAPPPPEEGEPATKTTSSYDGQSFTIEVTKEQEGETEESLTVTGYASPGEEIIEFTGSTSEPNSVVTLIFNGNVTVIVVSDANGEWATYISAEQLGIEPGQESNVSIEAIAAKGALRSDRVTVGSVTISRASEGEIEADFLTVVADSAVVTAINEVVQEVAIVIEEQEEEIQTTLTIAAPVVIASSAPLWGYLPYLPTLIYHFFTYLVGFIGRRKQKGERLYGVAYDAITKEPLGLAIIRVYRSMSAEKLIATKVTDKQGRYDFLLEPGEYRFEIKKPGYTFPSAIVTGEIDGDYENIYDAKAKYVVSETETITIPDVPLDPENAEQKFEIAGVFKKAWLTLQKAGSHLAVPILIVGSLISVAVVMTIPENPTNWILAALYILMLILQLSLRPKITKAWGVVYDVATNAVLPLTTMQLIEPEFGKVVKSRLSDYQGRFNFMPEPGKYVIKANKEGYEQTEVVEGQKDRKPISGEVSIDKPDQALTGDVAMRQA